MGDSTWRRILHAAVSTFGSQPLGVVQCNPPNFLLPEYYYSWEKTTASSCRHLADAVVCGHDTDRSQLWVGRANYKGNLLPCKIRPTHQAASVSYHGKEESVNDFEVLTADPARVQWVSGTNGNIPSDAVFGGRTSSGDNLYIGRARHQGSLCPGKIHPSHSCMYIPFAGREIRVTNYECLVISKD